MIGNETQMEVMREGKLGNAKRRRRRKRKKSWRKR